MKKVASDEWLQCLSDQMLRPRLPGTRGTIGSRGTVDQDLKRLPFFQSLFLDIARNFYIHKSAVRAISRTDIPAFSRAEVLVTTRDSTLCPAYGEFQYLDLERRWKIRSDVSQKS